MNQRSNSHIWIGLTFTLLAIVVAGVIYLGVRSDPSMPTIVTDGDAAPLPQVPQAEGGLPEYPVEDTALETPPEPMAENAPSARPPLPTSAASLWLVGTWRPAATEANGDGRTIESCDTDSGIITYRADGTYVEGDGGDEGLWWLDASQMTYFPKDGNVYQSTLTQVAPYVMIEAGYKGGSSSRYVRCE